MKQFVLLFFFIFHLFTYLFGQAIPNPQRMSVIETNAQTLELTLLKAQELAVKNNPDFQVFFLEAEVSKRITEQLRLRRIPMIYGDFNLQHNLILPITPVPAKIFNPNAGEEELMHLQFTTKWTSNVGVNASYDLFNPTLSGEIKQSEIETKIKEIDKSLDRNQLLFDVGNMYYSCLIATEQIRLAEVDTLSKFKILEMTQKQFDAGRITLSTLNQVKLDKNNTQSNYQESLKIYKQTKDNLLFLMGYSPDEQINIVFKEQINNILEETKSQNHQQTVSLNLARLVQQNTLASVQLKTTKTSLLPTISLNAYYGTNYFDNNFELFKGNNWYGNSFVNIGLRIPLTERIDQFKKIAQIKIQQQIINENIRSRKNQNQLNMNKAQSDIDFYKADLVQRQENLILAEENMNIAIEQYEKGRLLIRDYYNEVYSFQKERTAYLESLYKLFVAKLSLEKEKQE